MKNINTIIYDMDGVIIDSEPLWRISMIEQFNKVGVPLTMEDCHLTTGLRIKEVIRFHYARYNFSEFDPLKLNDMILERLMDLIHEQGESMPGLIEALDYFKSRKFKIGLASSSDLFLIEAVINSLNIAHYFDAVCSAGNLEYGKPHPQVFLDCAQILDAKSHECMVIEDSVNGVIAGKAALMKVIAIPEPINFESPKYSIADFKLSSLVDIKSVFEK